MNKTSIEWCDMSWNPVTGCLHGCEYCYARKRAENPYFKKGFPRHFEPMFHPQRLNDTMKMKKRQTIFVVDMGDLFGEWVPNEWIRDVFEACIAAPQHTYLFLTKNPQRYLEIPAENFHENMWFGTSINGQSDQHRIPILQKLDANTFISFEPLLGRMTDANLDGIGQVIIGAQTKPSKKVTPEMVKPIWDAALSAGNVPIFFKDSMPAWAKKRRELVWSLNKPTVVMA